MPAACPPRRRSRSPLAEHCLALPWRRVAEDEVHCHTQQLADTGHILSLFDADGQMLYADGDPAILDAMRELHFMPGALWSEAAVGTNGPGTALLLGRPGPCDRRGALLRRMAALALRG